MRHACSAMRFKPSGFKRLLSVKSPYFSSPRIGNPSAPNAHESDVRPVFNCASSRLIPGQRAKRRNTVANDLKNYPVQYVNGKIWVNNHAHVLQAKKDISSNKFLKYSISKINIEPFLVGGGRAKLNANIMMKINIYVPLDIQEQEKIGKQLFQKLDNQIDLQQKELEKLKNIKKASLSKMFV